MIELCNLDGYGSTTFGHSIGRAGDVYVDNNADYVSYTDDSDDLAVKEPCTDLRSMEPDLQHCTTAALMTAAYGVLFLARLFTIFLRRDITD